jgi:hypothetical protein
LTDGLFTRTARRLQPSLIEPFPALVPECPEPRPAHPQTGQRPLQKADAVCMLHNDNPATSGSFHPLVTGRFLHRAPFRAPGLFEADVPAHPAEQHRRLSTCLLPGRRIRNQARSLTRAIFLTSCMSLP